VLLQVGGGSSLIALLLGLLLARKLARPVEALAETAGRLARGDLDARVGPGGSNVAEVERLVSAFNQMADEIQHSQTQLVQAERVAAWREIAQGLAHELKNPLTPILGAMDVIRKARALDRQDFDEILDEQARAVVDEVMRLKELADEFARFARLPDAKPEQLDLPELLDGAVALYSSVDDTLRIVRDYATDTPPLFADRNQLQTVITNLVKNALEAMGTSGTLVLGLNPVTLADGGPGVEIRVGDSGPGIPEEVRDKLFTPYFTTKGSRGTGLGLAMTHRIVVEHGGTIVVLDSSEGGAEFSLRLPVRPRQAPPQNS
jgi:nitrogen fixation/metabolism regulation signal transduction histidine kinase